MNEKTTCTRCRRRPALIGRIRARALEDAIVDEVTALCSACRVASGQENARAMSRRTGKDVKK